MDAEDNNLVDFHNQNWTLTLALYIYKKIDFNVINNDLANSTEIINKQKKIDAPVSLAKSNQDKELEFLES